MSHHTNNANNTNAPPTNGPGTQPGASQPALEKTYFEAQREMLVLEIAQSLEHVLQNVNQLNRSLEEVIAVGTEFSPVEALWSQFENVMAKPEEESGQQQQHRGEADDRREETGNGSGSEGDGEGGR